MLPQPAAKRHIKPRLSDFRLLAPATSEALLLLSLSLTNVGFRQNTNTLNLSNSWLTAEMLQLAGREEVCSDQKKRDFKIIPLNQKAISSSNSQV